MNLNISYNWLKSLGIINRKVTVFITLFLSLVLVGCTNNANNQNDLKGSVITEERNINIDAEKVEKNDNEINAVSDNILNKEQDRLQLILDQKRQELGQLERNISIAQHERSATGYTGNIEERQVEIDKLKKEIKNLENQITTQQ